MAVLSDNKRPADAPPPAAAAGEAPKRAKTAGEAEGAEPKPGTGIWSAGEHERFLAATIQWAYGPQDADTAKSKWPFIAACVGSRTTLQCRSHAQKHFDKMRRHEKKRIAELQAAEPKEPDPNADAPRRSPRAPRPTTKWAGVPAAPPRQRKPRAPRQAPAAVSPSPPASRTFAPPASRAFAPPAPAPMSFGPAPTMPGLAVFDAFAAPAPPSAVFPQPAAGPGAMGGRMVSFDYGEFKDPLATGSSGRHDLDFLLDDHAGLVPAVVDEEADWAQVMQLDLVADC